MRYAILENEIIVNVIIADEKFIKKNFPLAVLCPEQFGVGDGFNGEEFFSNQITAPLNNENISE